jgi:hypothetical protein
MRDTVHPMLRLALFGTLTIVAIGFSELRRLAEARSERRHRVGFERRGGRGR